MSPEERELLNKTAALAEENHKMLLAIKKRMFWATVLRSVYWVIIIGSLVGAFYFLQPYWDGLKGIYGGAGEAWKSLGN